MNKVINVFSGILLALYSGLVMSLIYDLSVSSTISFKNLPYKVEICTGIALVIFMLGVLRIKRKWQGANDMVRFKGFHFVRKVARPALNLSLLYAIAEVVFMLLFIAFLANLAKLSTIYVIPMLIVVGILLVEAIVFSIKIMKGGPAFRLGINKSAVAYYNREMHIYYFTGLTRIEMHQDMINFQYKDDLNIFLPLEIIKKEDRVAFKEALIETINTKVEQTVYMDDAFRNIS